MNATLADINRAAQMVARAQATDPQVLVRIVERPPSGTADAFPFILLHETRPTTAG